MRDNGRMHQIKKQAPAIGRQQKEQQQLLLLVQKSSISAFHFVLNVVGI